MICEHTTGCPDCEDRCCRRRWLVGSTTGPQYRPAPVGSLLADILETWQGWFTEPELWHKAQLIRPELDAGVIRTSCQRLRANGRVMVGGVEIVVESRLCPSDPFSTSTAGPSWLMRAR